MTACCVDHVRARNATARDSPNRETALGDRCTAADQAFLDLEGLATDMPIGVVGLYDLPPLQIAAGGPRYRPGVQANQTPLALPPRFRQGANGYVDERVHRTRESAKSR
jgi:hypothetical protein